MIIQWPIILAEKSACDVFSCYIFFCKCRSCQPGLTICSGIAIDVNLWTSFPSPIFFLLFFLHFLSLLFFFLCFPVPSFSLSFCPFTPHLFHTLHCVRSRTPKVQIRNLGSAVSSRAGFDVELQPK